MKEFLRSIEHSHLLEYTLAAQIVLQLSENGEKTRIKKKERCRTAKLWQAKEQNKNFDAVRKRNYTHCNLT